MSGTAEQQRARRAKNPELYRSLRRSWRANNKQKVKESAWRSNLMSNYGLSPERYFEMIDAQGGVCVICRGIGNNRGAKLCVDHCHATGKVRGLLCTHCNAGLGNFRDNIGFMHAGIRYLEAANDSGSGPPSGD